MAGDIPDGETGNCFLHVSLGCAIVCIKLQKVGIIANFCYWRLPDTTERIKQNIHFLLCNCCSGFHNDAIPEGDRSFLQREIQFLFSIAENFSAKRIDSEQSIATGVAIGRVSNVLGMINDPDRNRFLFFDASKQCPVSFCSPCTIPSDPFAGQVITSHPFVIYCRHSSSIPLRVYENVGLSRRQLQLPCYTTTKESIFNIPEQNIFIGC